MYRHFKTRDALINHLSQLCLQDLVKALEGSEHLVGQAALEASFDALAPLADRYHFLTHYMERVDAEVPRSNMEERQTQGLHSLIDQAKELGEIAPSLPTAWIAALFDATLLASWTLVQAGTATSTEATGYAKRSFFRGCGI